MTVPLSLTSWELGVDTDNDDDDDDDELCGGLCMSVFV
jgi:hypothetical protein